MMLDWHVLVEIGQGRTIVVSGENYADTCKASAAVRNLVKMVEGFEAERKQWGETVDDFARIGGCLAEERDRLKTENERLRADRQHFYDLARRLELKMKAEESKVASFKEAYDSVVAQRNEARAELKEANAQLGDSQLDRINARKELRQQADISTCLKQCCDERDAEINALKAELEQLRAVPLVEITGIDARAICCDTAAGPMTMVMNNAPACIKITGHARFHVTKSEPTGHF